MTRPITSILIAVAAICAVYWLGWGDQIQEIVLNVAPWVPLFITLYLLSGAIDALVNGVVDFFKWIGKVVAGIVSAVVFIVFVLPVMAANTFLLGPFGHWMWANMFPVLILLVLSMAAYWIRGGQTANIDRKILLAGIFLALFVIGGDFLLNRMYGVEYFRARIKSGTDYVYLDPAKFIPMKAGDIVDFSVYGKISGGGKTYPPKGDSTDLRMDGSIPRPQGQIEFRIYESVTKYGRVPVVMDVAGADQVAGYDVGDVAGGYYLSGSITIPNGTPNGWLGIGFFNLVPSSGTMKLRIHKNPQNSIYHKMSQIGWFASLCAVIAFTAVYWFASGLIVGYFSGSSSVIGGVAVITPARPVLKALALVLFGVLYIATILALIEVKGLSRGDMNKWLADHGFEPGPSVSTKVVVPSPSSVTITTPPLVATAPAVDPNCVYQPASNELGKGVPAYDYRRKLGCDEVIFMPVSRVGDVGTIFFWHSPCGDAMRPVVTMSAGGIEVSQLGKHISANLADLRPDQWFYVVGNPGAKLALKCPAS